MTDTPPPSNPVPTSSSSTADATLLPDKADVDKNKVMAILAYIGILVLVPLLAAKESPFARYHTNQGLVLFIGAVICWVPLMILDVIPLVNCVGLILTVLLWICVITMMILGIVHAANGQMKPLPVIGKFKILK
jgi:uncharacterized membrane protein